MVLKFHGYALENIQSKLCIHICFLVQLVKGYASGSRISSVGKAEDDGRNQSVADCYLHLHWVKGQASGPGISSVGKKGTLKDYYNHPLGQWLLSLSNLQTVFIPLCNSITFSDVVSHSAISSFSAFRRFKLEFTYWNNPPQHNFLPQSTQLLFYWMCKNPCKKVVGKCIGYIS